MKERVMETTFLQCEQVIASFCSAFNLEEREILSLRDSLGERMLQLFDISFEQMKSQLSSLLSEVKEEPGKLDMLDTPAIQDIIFISNSLTENLKDSGWRDVILDYYLQDSKELRSSLDDTIWREPSMRILQDIDLPNGIILFDGEKEKIADFVRLELVDMLTDIQAGFYLSTTAEPVEIEVWERLFTTYINSPMTKISKSILKEA